MDAFEFMYRVTFWMFPILVVFMFVVLLLTIWADSPTFSSWKAIVQCPKTRKMEAVRLRKFSRFGLVKKIEVVSCTAQIPGCVSCDQACLRLKQNQLLIKSLDLEKVA